MNACTQSAAEALAAAEAATLTLSDAERQPCEVWTRVMGAAIPGPAGRDPLPPRRQPGGGGGP